jgi:hypothetical protein
MEELEAMKNEVEVNAGLHRSKTSWLHMSAGLS